MDIALDGLIKGLTVNPQDPQITKAIAEAQRLKLTSDQNFINLFVTAFKNVNPGAKLAPHFARPGSKLTAASTDNQVVSYINEKASAAMSQTYQVLRKRIDKFGVAQPTISLDENKGIITVELAGASDPERVRKYLQSTANLQFWEVYTLNDNVMQTGFVNADKALEAALYGAPTVDSAALKAIDTLQGAAKDSARKALDSAAAAGRQNPLFRVLNPARPYQNGGLPGYVGMSLLKDTGKVNQYLAMPAVKNNCTCPPTRSAPAGAPPRYGTCSISMPAIFSSIAAHR